MVVIVTLGFDGLITASLSTIVQKDIRTGHQQTIDTVLEWLRSDGNLADLSICDAGCGLILTCHSWMALDSRR